MKSFIKYMGKCTKVSLLKGPKVGYITKPSKLQAFRSWLTTHIQHIGAVDRIISFWRVA